MTDIVLNKVQSIQRCVSRAREEYRADPDGFDANFTRQDAAILNILRACEQTIDLANHTAATRKLGVPATTAETFELLRQAGIIDAELAEKLINMVRFRNIVIHQYRSTDLEIVKSAILSGLNDLILFGDRILEEG
ncbi:MAG: DUF86 domain-containing protein [Candidatus Hydrogenedentes bacterium]|nr:DUF86 domain-containing protein [Candidatus Hydrogenedentota bacterium]